jgi:hypothetical protein
MAISDQDIQKYRCILMYDDETMKDAVAAYRDDKMAAEWWTLVVDVGGKYAVTSFADVSARIKDGGKAFLESKLGGLVGTALKTVEVVVEQSGGDLASVRDKASATATQMAVVVDRGEFKGVISAATSRGGAGLFGSELVKLAGQYSDLPTTGLVSRRRQEAMAARKKKE